MQVIMITYEIGEVMKIICII